MLRVTILAVLACPLLAAPAHASQLLALNADAASLRVNVRGDPDALNQAILRDGRLAPVDSGRLIYALSP